MRIGTVIILGMLTLSAVGCSTLTRELEQEDAVSAQVTTRIKAALVEAPEVDAAAIGVELVDGTVVLNGFVASRVEADQAMQLAADTAPGYPIVDQLEVK